jgi:ribose transport system substrate-binding protein
MSDAGTAANGLLTRYPETQGVYVSFATPAVDVLEVIRGLGRKDIALVTLDLDVICALDMINGGNVIGIVADMPYAIGYVEGLVTGYALLDKKAPAFVVSPSFAITKDNIEEGWLQSMGEELPAELKKALNK